MTWILKALSSFQYVPYRLIHLRFNYLHNKDAEHEVCSPPLKPMQCLLPPATGFFGESATVATLFSILMAETVVALMDSLLLILWCTPVVTANKIFSSWHFARQKYDFNAKPSALVY
jgi:hypothetical protein